MIESIVPASRAEWLDLRKSTIGASEAAAILGAHPYLTPYELWVQKSGLAPPVEETAMMRRGKLLEPIAIDLLREERPEWAVTSNPIPGGKFYRDIEAGLSCTPDCFVSSNDEVTGGAFGICQIKTVNPHAFKEGWLIDGEIHVPAYVAIQALQEMALTGATWCCIEAVVGFDLDVHIIDVAPHPGILGRIRTAVSDFWRRVRENDPYPPDYARDGDVIKSLYADDDGGEIDLSGNERAIAILSKREVMKTREAEGALCAKERKEIDAELIHMLGNAARGTLADGRVIEAKTIRKKGFLVEPTSYRQIRIKQQRKAA